MSTRTLTLDEQLYAYLQGTSLREPPAFRRCRLDTAELPMSNMQISPEQGQFLHLQAKLLGATNAIEIGSFTGYSGLWLASALPSDGRLVACDINEEWTARARHYWEDAGVMNRIDLRLAPAIETLDELLASEADNHFDFIFIDADKEMYDEYYERSLKLLQPGGLVAIDNVLWNGKVADRSADDPDTTALRQLNEKLHNDERVDIAMVPIGDGVTLARKRES